MPEHSRSQPVDILSVARREGFAVRLVDRVVRPLLRHLHVRVAEHVRPQRRIERKAMHAIAGAVNKNRRRPVNNITGGDLLTARL